MSSDPAVRRAAGRKRRLDRGYRMWDLDRRLCPEPTRRAILVTFTTRPDEQANLADAQRRFWRRVRETWVGTRYFAWMELHRSGAIHYHAWWINPPHAKRVHLTAWVERTWGLGRTNVRFPRDRFSEAYMASYVAGYVKKMGRKQYQQAYADIPRELRTFMTQRTDIPVSELKDHIDHDVYEYLGEGVVPTYAAESGPGRWELRGASLRFVERRVHSVPRGGHCSAIAKRRDRPRPRWDAPPTPGVSTRGRRPYDTPLGPRGAP